MRTISSTLKSKKNAVTCKPIHLYTIHDYNGAGGNLYYAEYDTDITFDGITYTKFPITHDAISENSHGTIDNVRVSVSNVNRIVEGYLQAYTLRGKKVTIKLVFQDALSSPDTYIDYVYWIDSYSSNQDVVTFVLTSKFDVLDIELPLRKYSRNYCAWKFKGTECGYTGIQTTCDKTKSTCKTTMNNLSRFGGFPSVPTTRIYVS